MHRNVAVLSVSIINGFCIFLLCMRLWRIERAEILTPATSVSIALIAKILYNLLSDKGRLTVDCFWNTSLLIVYAFFIHAADHHDLITRYRSAQPTPHYIFMQNSTSAPRIEYPWTEYKFIVSSILLMLVIYNPFNCPQPKTTSKAKIDHEMLNKYRRIIKLKQQQQQEEGRNLLVLDPTRVRSSSQRKTKSHLTHSKYKSKKTPACSKVQETKSNCKHGDEDTNCKDDVNVNVGSFLAKIDGTGDSTFFPKTLRPFDLRTIKTQTNSDLATITSSISKGIQCVRRQPPKSKKALVSRPAGSSLDYLFCNSDKSTNTNINPVAPCHYPKKVKTKTKSTDPLPSSTYSKPRFKAKCKDCVKDAHQTIMAYKNLKKDIRIYLNPSLETNEHEHTPSKIPKPFKLQPQAKSSEIFNLDDLINAKYRTGPDFTRSPRGQSLDVIPTKDNQTLNVLYITDRMLNSVGFNRSSESYDYSRDGSSRQSRN
ncbi:uncharacterized protein [Atheta coriaria]|uniref:uncharacterized protein isoform X2 n=1 Tax=Dalotia coriaria TaxID=877792 RepID=UPI0031F3BEE1